MIDQLARVLHNASTDTYRVRGEFGRVVIDVGDPDDSGGGVGQAVGGVALHVGGLDDQRVLRDFLQTPNTKANSDASWHRRSILHLDQMRGFVVAAVCTPGVDQSVTWADSELSLHFSALHHRHLQALIVTRKRNEYEMNKT